MNGKRARSLRRTAELATVGMPASETKRLYRQIKKKFIRLPTPSANQKNHAP